MGKAAGQGAEGAGPAETGPKLTTRTPTVTKPKCKVMRTTTEPKTCRLKCHAILSLATVCCLILRHCKFATHIYRGVYICMYTHIYTWVGVAGQCASVCVCAKAKLWEILSLLFVVVLAVAVVFSGTLSASHYVYAALDTRHCINSSETLKQSGNAKTTSKYYLSLSVFAVFVFISAVSVLPHFPVSLFPRFPTKDFVLTAAGTEANAYAEISKSWFRPFCCAVKNSSKCLWVAHTFAFSLQPPDSRFQPPSAFSGGKCE